MFVIGLLVFGMGMNASQQLRVAATDMFPPHASRPGARLCGDAALKLIGLGRQPQPWCGLFCEAMAKRITAPIRSASHW